MLSDPKSRSLWLKVAAGAVVLLAVALLFLSRTDVGAQVIASGIALIDRFMALLRGAGPLAFFTAMALLPAAGVPMMFFSLSAGAAFGGELGMGGVVAAGLAAIIVNLVVTYWLGRRWLRPAVAGLIARLGYKLPEVEAGDMVDLIVLLRVTPGIPIFVQNYLLGLANAPFGKYLAISCPISCSYTAIGILFGDAVLHGRAKIAVYAGGLLIALMAVVHLLRRHYAGREKAA